ncbi:hypothetical protein [Sinomonas sp. B1-1]
MAFHQGEVYRCPGCGCEVIVTKDAPPDCEDDQNPTCCCGTMDKLNAETA